MGVIMPMPGDPGKNSVSYLNLIRKATTVISERPIFYSTDRTRKVNQLFIIWLIHSGCMKKICLSTEIV